MGLRGSGVLASRFMAELGPDRPAAMTGSTLIIYEGPDLPLGVVTLMRRWIRVAKNSAKSG